MRRVSQEARIGSVQGNHKGKSDAVKQQYWLYVSMQRQRNQVGDVRLYPILPNEPACEEMRVAR